MRRKGKDYYYFFLLATCWFVVILPVVVRAFVLRRPTTTTPTRLGHRPIISVVVGSTAASHTTREEELEEDPPSYSWWKPPPHLEHLSVGETLMLVSKQPPPPNENEEGGTTIEHPPPPPEDTDTITVTRVGTDPPLFHVRGLLLPAACETLMQRDWLQKEPAGTKAGTVRQRFRSRVGWIGGGWEEEDASEDDDNGENSSHGDGNARTAARTVADDLTRRAAALFSSSDYWMLQPERLQVAHYEPGGRYSLHHDGFQRGCTVLHYLNGVAGTWFPFVDADQIPATLDLRETDRVILKDKVPGRDGVVFVGKEQSPENGNYDTDGTDNGVPSPFAVVRVQPGDSVVFYNYCVYDEDDDNNSAVLMNWKSLHAALPAKEEKWIATNWFQMEGEEDEDDERGQ